MGKKIYHKFGRLPNLVPDIADIVGNNQNNNPSKNRIGSFDDY